jgi:hypothetical protein
MALGPVLVFPPKKHLRTKLASRHERIDLLVLKRIFETVPASVAEFVCEAPNGIPNRRAWYLYELLTGRKLKKVSDAKNVTAIDVLDAEAYFTGKPQLSRWHRVRDNLLGISRFCPIIRRTKLLTEFRTQNLAKKASEIIGRTARIWLPVRRASCYSLMAGRVSKLKESGRRATGLSGGDAPCYRQGRTNSLSMKSFVFTAFSSKTIDLSTEVSDPMVCS